mgnify:CR=1 FL=1
MGDLFSLDIGRVLVFGIKPYFLLARALMDETETREQLLVLISYVRRPMLVEGSEVGFAEKLFYRSRRRPF